MVFGKTIKLFLVDGDPNGRMTCELSNWTGKAYKIPRNAVKKCIDRPELNTTGVYMLIGKYESSIYIGEAEGIYDRLKQQLNDKDFWNEAIVFISKDENLNKAHIKYLENRLYEIAVKVNRYKIENTQIPTQAAISEADKAEMEEFLENIKMLVNTLGYKIFEEIRETSKDTENEKELFFIRAARGANGIGNLTSEGFVVLRNSQIADPVTNSYPKTMKKSRNNLITEGVIIKKDEKLFLNEDYIFSSSSTAAMIVMGRSANGLNEWKMKDGKTLKDFETEGI